MRKNTKTQLLKKTVHHLNILQVKTQRLIFHLFTNVFTFYRFEICVSRAGSLQFITGSDMSCFDFKLKV